MKFMVSLGSCTGGRGNSSRTLFISREEKGEKRVCEFEGKEKVIFLTDYYSFHILEVNRGSSCQDFYLLFCGVGRVVAKRMTLQLSKIELANQMSEREREVLSLKYSFAWCIDMLLRGTHTSRHSELHSMYCSYEGAF